MADLRGREELFKGNMDILVPDYIHIMKESDRIYSFIGCISLFGCVVYSNTYLEEFRYRITSYGMGIGCQSLKRIK